MIRKLLLTALMLGLAACAGIATVADSTDSPAEAPSAFRRVNLDQASLDKILRQVGAAGGPES